MRGSHPDKMLAFNARLTTDMSDFYVSICICDVLFEVWVGLGTETSCFGLNLLVLAAKCPNVTPNIPLLVRQLQLPRCCLKYLFLLRQDSCRMS